MASSPTPHPRRPGSSVSRRRPTWKRAGSFHLKPPKRARLGRPTIRARPPVADPRVPHAAVDCTCVEKAGEFLLFLPFLASRHDRIYAPSRASEPGDDAEPATETLTPRCLRIAPLNADGATGSVAVQNVQAGSSHLFDAMQWGVSEPGVPDILVLYRGKLIAIELKSRHGMCGPACVALLHHVVRSDNFASITQRVRAASTLLRTARAAMWALRKSG
jgi:hypothetical protein